MKSQNLQILSHLKKGHSLTALAALRRFRCMRLASRINDLRDQGHNITSTMIDVGDKRVASYSLAV